MSNNFSRNLAYPKHTDAALTRYKRDPDLYRIDMDVFRVDADDFVTPLVVIVGGNGAMPEFWEDVRESVAAELDY